MNNSNTQNTDDIREADIFKHFLIKKKKKMNKIKAILIYLAIMNFCLQTNTAFF